MNKQNYAPGMRVVIRDAEWRIRRADDSGDGGYLLTCDGISELVRGKEGLFLTKLEQKVEILDPAKTHLVEDESANSLLRITWCLCLRNLLSSQLD